MTRTETDLALETRAGLPEALKALIDDYPREAWEADPNFSGLIRFWLDRHLMFRRLVGTMIGETERTLDGAMEDRQFSAHLSRYGSMLMGELHGHHTIEDTHFFPIMKPLDPRVATGFDILDRDHHDIHDSLTAFADTGNAALRRIAEGASAIDALAAFLKDLQRVERFLDRHLADEEDLVVPVLLRYTPAGLV